ncbi:MAG: ATP-dependent zinc metalloprotease FtsH, partial [Anaerolineae bacterium]
LGPMTFGQKEELVFLGREIAEQRDYSEEIAQEIDQEIQNIVQNAYRRARQILTEKRDKLEALARALLEKETIEREEFLALMAA